MSESPNAPSGGQAEPRGVFHVATPAAGASAMSAPAKKDGTPSPGKRDGEPAVPTTSFGDLFRFATRTDILCYVVASIAAGANGVIFPLFSLAFGAFLGELTSATADIIATINQFALYFLIIAVCAALCTLIETSLPIVAAERQIKRVRVAYLRSLLQQDQEYYDSHKGNELAAALMENSLTMVEGMAEKTTNTIRFGLTFVAGLAVGFARSWQLTLLMFSAIPILAVVIYVMWRFTVGYESAIAKAYAKAGDAASETFANVRTVLSYGAVEAEVARYDSYLAEAAKNGESKGFWMGCSIGVFFGINFFLYGLCTIVAGVLIVNSRNANPACTLSPTLAGCFSGSNAIQTLMAVLIGVISLGHVGPSITAFASARAAAFKLYAIIDRVPKIKLDAPAGARPDPASLRGTIEFRGVTFAYPSRPTEVVLRNFNCVIAGGTSVAVVGESGSGKSTLMQLIQRYYDPQEGAILMDGIDVRDWNLVSLRNRIGIVSQEPTLFGTTIAENIAFGAPTDALVTPTLEDIEAAARAANAHDFITHLPAGYDSVVGTSVSSTQLSGGQRQRVCIARAILRNPVYLLLDEATSAMDTASERVVQAALDMLLAAKTTTLLAHVRGLPSLTSSSLEDAPVAAARGEPRRTSLIIAHRLSTVTSSDRIIVLSNGRIIEEGNHVALCEKPDGVYRRLRLLQDTAAPSGTWATTETPPAVKFSAGSASAMSAGSGTGSKGINNIPSSQSSSDVVISDGVAPDANVGSPADVVVAVGHRSSYGVPAIEEAETLPRVDRRRVWALQRQELGYLAVGLCMSIADGVLQPVFAILWSNIINVFFSPDTAALQQQTREYLGWFTLIAVCQLVLSTLRFGCFILAGERLTRRLRTMTYRAVLRQEVAFFDDPNNSVGRLTTRLAVDAAEVKGGTGEGLSVMFRASSAIVAAVIIALVTNWRLALVVCAIFPLLIVSSVLQGKAYDGSSQGTAKSLEESGHIAVEATSAIRTVTAFNLQASMLEAYSHSLEGPLQSGYGRAWSAGVGLAFSQFILFAGYSLSFYAGGWFIFNGWLTFAELMRVFLVLTLAAQAVGFAVNFGPDSAKADRATRSMFHLLDRMPAIDNLNTTGYVPPTSQLQTGNSSAAVIADGKLPGAAGFAGVIELRNVRFHYPSRPESAVLRGVSLTIAPGQKVALVGPSGCGKCFAYDTLIMMADGSVKPVQDVIVGDAVMGDNSTPRQVLSLARGREAMYRVDPIKGDSYVVNESHILSLKVSIPGNLPARFCVPKGGVVDISVHDYQSLSPSARNGLKGYRVPVVFPHRVVPLDAYMLGYWLGDGNSAEAAITTVEPEVIAYFSSALAPLGLAMRNGYDSMSDTWRICSKQRTDCSFPRAGTNAFLNALRELDVLNNKHVPHAYSRNSRSTQLELLAGVLDADGHYYNGCYDVTLVNECLMDGIIYIARSLGFAAFKKKCLKTCTNGPSGPVTGTYYRTVIHGTGLEQIPVKVPRKRASPRLQRKDALVTGITVEPLGEGDYYGFEIDGNHRFLLGDYTVTHNSTIIQLLERFYDPDGGEILLDGRPIAEFNVAWLRSRMGLISQEPVLFADSITYNIRYPDQHWDKGIPMDAPADYVVTPAQQEVSPEVAAAAVAAHAFEFISGFKFGFATHVGSRGGSLSGGQRQRVAIARAILRKPQLALCDEATAALDSEAERHVQVALDAMLQPEGASGGGGSGERKTTSVVIAHRLSTIRDADVIFVIKDGVVVEQGTHDALMAHANGLYRSMALAQGIVKE